MPLLWTYKVVLPNRSTFLGKWANPGPLDSETGFPSRYLFSFEHGVNLEMGCVWLVLFVHFFSCLVEFSPLEGTGVSYSSLSRGDDMDFLLKAPACEVLRTLLISNQDSPLGRTLRLTCDPVHINKPGHQISRKWRHQHSPHSSFCLNSYRPAFLTRNAKSLCRETLDVTGRWKVSRHPPAGDKELPFCSTLMKSLSSLFPHTFRLRRP